MEKRNFERAIEIYTKLIMGERVSNKKGENPELYEDYSQNSEIYEMVTIMLRNMNLNLYEYQEALYLTAGDGNRVFGYTNEELKKLIGLRNNRELYLCYFIIYHIILAFYSESSGVPLIEYIKIEEVVEAVTKALLEVKKKKDILEMEEVEEESLTAVSNLWEELPLMNGDELKEVRASRGSKVAMVKLTFHFLVSQDLMLEMEGRYYPKDRFIALLHNYFEEYRGRLYELLDEKEREVQ